MNYLDRIAIQIRKRVPKSDLPDDDTHALFRTYAVLLLAKGVDVTPADVHNAWVAWMLSINPSHESLVPFTALDPDTASDDDIYADAIQAVAKEGMPASD